MSLFFCFWNFKQIRKWEHKATSPFFQSNVPLCFSVVLGGRKASTRKEMDFLWRMSQHYALSELRGFAKLLRILHIFVAYLTIGDGRFQI